MSILERFLPRQEFSSYEDFKQNYTVNIPEHFNFGFDIVDAWAAEDKTKKALVWCDDHGGERIFTFEDIRRKSNQAANFFRACGICKGSVVMLILRRRWEYWVAAVALHKLGATLIPGSLQLAKNDLVYRANAAQISMLVCVDDPYVIEQVEGARAEAPCIKHLAIAGGERAGWMNFDEECGKYPEDFARPAGAQASGNDDIMLIYFTSGTTSHPKMVQHTFTHPLGHIVTAKYWQRVQENKLHMSVSDSGWAKFGWGKIYGQWCCGAVIFAYDMDKFVPLKLLEKLEHYKVTTFCAPPTMFRFMLQEDIAKFDLSSIQTCCNAGEPLNPEIWRKWLDLTGVKMTEGFGQSETTVLLANFEWFDPKPGSMGKPSPIYDIRLLNAAGEECEDGEEGEICVFGIDREIPVGLFHGYYHNEAQTKAALGGCCYNLGDVAWRDSEGYYWFVGRNDDVIKCSGYRIGPFEVESALVEHPAVIECAITGAPDPIRGQVVKATVVLAKGYAPSDELKKELQAHVKHATAPYKYPRIIEFVDELPKTIGGKIKRAQIRHADEGQAE